MKKLVTLLVFALVLSNCSEPELTQRTELSDTKLKEILRKSDDFNRFVDLTIQDHRETMRIMENDKTRNILDGLVSKYGNYINFGKEASPEEKLVLNDLLKGNIGLKRGGYYVALIKKLKSDYIFDEKILTQFIGTEIANELEHRGKINGIARLPYEDCGTTCSNVRTSVYISELNYHYYVAGASITDADARASVASYWAYYGCISGCA